MSYSGRAVLVTGAAGYLGTELVRALVSRGASVVALDAVPSSVGTVVEVGSLTDLDFCRGVLQRHHVRLCFHLAGRSGVAASLADPHEAVQANVHATSALLEAVRTSPCDMVVVSSNHVYGHQSTVPIPEDAPLNAQEPYGSTKACADILARCYAQTYSLPIGVARITNTYGGLDPHSQHLITATIRSVLLNEPPVITSDGRPVKGYMYIEDTLNALLRLGEAVGRAEIRGQAFNFAPTEVVSVLDLVMLILRTMGRPELRPSVLGSPRTDDRFEHEQLDVSKARTLLGWSAQYNLTEGLARTIRAFQEQLASPR